MSEHIDRKTYCGGSDAAAILGVSPWSTPVKLYRQKIGEGVDDEIDEARQKVFNRGKRLEPVVIDMLEEEIGVKITKRSPPENRNYHEDKEFPWMRAEIDFEFLVTPEIVEYCGGLISPSLIGTIQNGEIKTVHPLVAHKWGEMLTDDVPVEYAAQSMHGMMVSGRQFCLYGTLVGADDLTLYGVRRDDELIAHMRAREIAFWNCVQNRIPPDPVNLGDVKLLMYRIKGVPIEATDAIAGEVRALKILKDTIKAMESQAEAKQFEIAAFLFHNLQQVKGASLEDKTALTYAGKTLLTWITQAATRLDAKRIKEEAPELYQQYGNTTTSRVMRIK
jgi:putative phage-type endonuclease